MKAAQFVVTAFIAIALLVVMMLSFSALSPDGAPVQLLDRAGKAAVSAGSDGVWANAISWVQVTHQRLLQSLSIELWKVRGQNSVGWALILVSFFYGAIHAAGPGHGKAVLTTYQLTHPSRLRRAIVIGALASCLQGVTAIVLIYGLVGLAGWVPPDAGDAATWATNLSFALIALLGLYILYRAAKGLIKTVGHLRRAARHDDEHHHHHGHGHGDDCGCHHMPSSTDLDNASTFRSAAVVVFAMGLRPCSGALLVLVTAISMNLMWHGVFAVLAMSVGTAITVVLLAGVATKARQVASTLVAERSPLWRLAGGGAGLAAGIGLFCFGLSLLASPYPL